MDKDATRAARRVHRFESYESWLSFAGHQYLEGSDKNELRLKVMKDAKFTCAICGETCLPFDGDLEHIHGKRPLARCDCYNTQLADGTIHTNVRWVHGMFSVHDCHRKIHNREVKWRTKDSTGR